MLTAAIPPDFDLDEIKRYGSDRFRKPWITVGVRMTGPVRYARAIFYVHIEREDARQMYEEQNGRSKGYTDSKGRSVRRQSEPDLGLPNVCVLVPGQEMWSCHAWKAKVYLVVQATNDGSGERHMPLELLRAFGDVLDKNLPARMHD